MVGYREYDVIANKRGKKPNTKGCRAIEEKKPKNNTFVALMITSLRYLSLDFIVVSGVVAAVV